MNIYLAGPMRGYDLYNFTSFFAAAIALRREGHTVHNPAELDMSKGFNPAEPLDSEANAKVFNINDALREDFLIILREDTNAVVLLPGWRESSGACAEVVVAKFSGTKVYELKWLNKLVGGLPILERLEEQPTVSFNTNIYDGV